MPFFSYKILLYIIVPKKVQSSILWIEISFRYIIFLGAQGKLFGGHFCVHLFDLGLESDRFVFFVLVLLELADFG